MERQEILQIFSRSVKMILGKNLSKIIVYGSYARGDYREDSDIDNKGKYVIGNMRLIV